MLFNINRSTQSSKNKSPFSKMPNIKIEKDFNSLRQKHSKLKELLIKKFIKKYNPKEGDYIINNEITKFIKKGKFSDADLIELDKKIEKSILLNKKIEINCANTLDKSSSMKKIEVPRNDSSISLFPNNDNSQIINKSNLTMNKLRERDIPILKYNPSLSVGKKIKLNKLYKNQEEELAELEAELSRESFVKHPLKKFNFNGFKDEWSAIQEYNKREYHRQIIEEKKKDLEMKQRTKENLDEQIKLKLKRKLEEKLREEETNKIFYEHIKNLEKLEIERQEKLNQQREREKMSREAQMKDEFIRKRLTELKQKKYELSLLNKIKEDIEKDKAKYIQKKIQEKEKYKRIEYENIITRDKKRELLRQEKELDKLLNIEAEKMESKIDLERQRYLDYLKCPKGYVDEKYNSVLLNKMKNYQKEEENKMFNIILENKKKEKEDFIREKLRKKEESLKMKQFLDRQILEKKKDLEILKCLDIEQSRIWKIDEQKYIEEQKRIEKLIHDKNIKNSEMVKEQIKDKMEKQKLKGHMSMNEIALNRDILEKVENELK